MFQNTWISVFALTLFLYVVVVVGQGDQIVLPVAGGIFDGIREQVDRDRRVYYAFRGIPYANPPVGDKRWEDPVLKEVSGRTKAISFSEKCPQWNSAGNLTVGNEDCLYLNIYTPQLPSQGGRPGSVVNPSRSLLPVLVYIHGGGFAVGSGDSVGPRKFMKQDVVLVTFNYRLGALGYLSTGDESMPGNYGVLDQITALQWIKKYIRGFGGNPDQVTIFGDSAGAAGVHLLMLSPRVTPQKLFHRAILQSGSALCDWAVEPNPLKYAEAIGESVECSGGSEELKECLRGKTADDLVRATNSQLKFWIFPINAAPVVDNTSRPNDPVLSDTPARLMEAGAYAQIPVMAGINHDEGLMGYTSVHLDVGENFKNKEYFETQLVPDLLKNFFHDKGENEVVSKAVLSHYFEGIDVTTPQGLKLAVTEMSELIGDTIINSCHYEILEKFATNKQMMTYSYLFTHKTLRSPSILSRNIQTLRSQYSIQHPLFDFGVSHSDELFYLFDPVNIYPGNLNTPLTGIDERVSDIMTRIWVAFAQDGSPAAALQSYNLQPWRPVGQGNINYYNLTSTSAPMGTDYRKGEALFWLRTVPYVRELGEKIDSLSCYQLLFWIFLALFGFFLILTIVLAIVLHKKRTSQKVSLT